MRALILAAITMMLTAHALPRPDLAAGQGADDLGNETHMFHHFDRNQRTADRNHERLDGQGLHAMQRLQDRPQSGGWSTARERVVDRRFMQEPDYSEEQGPEGGSSTGNPATNTQ